MFFKKGVFNSAPLVPGTFFNIPSLGDVIDWLLQIEFSTDDSAPLTNPYVGEVGSVYTEEVDGSLAVLSGELIFTKQTTPIWGDLGVVDKAGVLRGAGITYFSKIKLTEFGLGSLHGFQRTDLIGGSGEFVEGAFRTEGAGKVSALCGSGINIEIFTATIDTYFEVCVILRASGAYFFVNDGGWELKSVSVISNQATVYPSMSSFDTSGRLNYMKMSQLGAPYDTVLELAMDSKDGAITAGDTFSAVSSNNAVNGDGNHEYILTAVQSSGSNNFAFRKQDINNYWSVFVDSAGGLTLYEFIAGVPTGRGALGAGALVGGERMVVIARGLNIKILYDDVLAFEYGGAINFQTETDVEFISFGVGGGAQNYRCYPVKVAGQALSQIERNTR